MPDKDVIATWAGNPPQALIMWVYDWVVAMLAPTVVRVPDVTGQGVPSSRRQLRRLGLRVRAVDQASALDRVRGMDPGPGTEAKRGTVVTLHCDGGGPEYS